MSERRTCLADLMDEGLLREMIEAKYIRVKDHPNEPLRIYNYSEMAMYDKVWNKATMTCRGLIADREGFIVARPWPKFFNLGQGEAASVALDEPVEITDKEDGSLGIGFPTLFNGYQVSTRGSFISDQAIWASNWLAEADTTWLNWLPDPTITPLFEIVYPANRIVRDYGGGQGLILLGAIDVETGCTYGPNQAAEILEWTGAVTLTFPERTLAEFMAGPNANRTNAEGIVARSGHKMVKVKQQAYIDLHRIVTGLSTTSVWEMMGDGYTVQEICEPLPDEFHDWVRKLASELTFELEQIQFKLADEFSPFKELDRKMFALSIVNHPLRPWLFLMYDGKDTKEAIWRTLKPAHEGRWG